MKKVEMYTSVENDKSAVGVKINDNSANLADLLDTWQVLADNPEVFKLYQEDNHGTCKGCRANCCSNPYIIPDLISFKKTAALLKMDYESFTRTYFEKDKLGVGLMRLKSNPCVFLQNNMCSIYPYRSLICRFYLCSNIMGDTEELIYKIAWTGIAATQVFAEERKLFHYDNNLGHSSFDRMFFKLIEEYRYKPELKLFFTAQDYTEIPLKPFLKA